MAKTQKQTRITFKNYQKEAMKFCFPACRNEQYYTFGIHSEINELFAKIQGMRAKAIRGDYIDNCEKAHQKKLEIRDEIGDVCWFLALCCDMNKLKFEEFARGVLPTNTDVAFAVFPFDMRNSCPPNVELPMSVLKRICRDMGIKLSDCLRANIAKLSSRQKRGKIKGDGDHR